MRYTAFLCAVALSWIATNAVAQSTDDIPILSDERAEVVACLGAIESESTTWNQCMGLLFAPCAKDEVGSEKHLLCLLAEREAWLASIEREQARAIAIITNQGGVELTQVMSQWYGYVGNKCAAVGANNVGTSTDAAQVGCEIAEMASVVGELKSCSDGRSTSPYCVIQE